MGIIHTSGISLTEIKETTNENTTVTNLLSVNILAELLLNTAKRSMNNDSFTIASFSSATAPNSEDINQINADMDFQCENRVINLWVRQSAGALATIIFK
jgi:hypothetical protein